MRVKVINKSGFDLPRYETALSAGMDVKYAGDKIVMEPGSRHLFKTGLFFELPEGVEAQVRPRSGLAYKEGVTVLNSPGTIDADYRGEIGVVLINHSNDHVVIHNGDRIAQFVFTRHEHISWDEVTELSSTERGEGGFGSTGKQ